MRYDPRKYSTLRSKKGLIYIGLLYWPQTAYEIGTEIESSGICKRSEVRDDVMNSMKKMGFISVHDTRIGYKLGQEDDLNIYLATSDVILDTVTQLLREILQIALGKEYNEDVLETHLDKLNSALELVSPLNRYFPEFIAEYCNSTTNVRNHQKEAGLDNIYWKRLNDLSWLNILSIYLYYVQRQIHAARNVVDLGKNDLPSTRQLEKLLSSFQDQKRKRKWTAPLGRKYFLDGMNDDIITYDEVKKLSTFMDSEMDLFNINSFSSQLLLLHVGLNDYHMGTNISSLYLLLSKDRVQVPLQQQLIEELELPLD